MLSLFPSLFDYSQLAPLILRVSLTIILIKTSYPSITQNEQKIEKSFGAARILSGIFLLLGFLTQAAVLIIILITIAETIIAKKQGIENKNKELKTLIFAMALALIFLGPGALSIDLPL